MSIVRGQLLGHPQPETEWVTATLVDLNGKQRVGYAEADQGEITTARVVRPEADGSWEFDLEPNEDVETPYGDSLWRIDGGSMSDTGRPARTYIAVPDTAGPHWLGDLRTDPPGGAAPVTYAVQSVNGYTGAVVLDAADVDADPEGSAAAAQAAAIAAAATDATTKANAAQAAATSAAATDATTKANAAQAAAISAASTYTDSEMAQEIARADAAYDPAGAATAAQAAAVATAEAYTDVETATHAAAADPHGDRAWATSQFVPLTGDIVGRARAMHKTADEPLPSSTTLQDDEHLALSLTANAVYALDMYLDIEGDSAGDFTMGWTVPSGTTMSWTESGPSAGNGNNIASIKYNRLGAGDSSGVGILPTGTVATPSGNIRVGATGGTLQFRWAQTAASATPTILKAGSWLRLHRIA